MRFCVALTTHAKSMCLEQKNHTTYPNFDNHSKPNDNQLELARLGYDHLLSTRTFTLIMHKIFM